MKALFSVDEVFEVNPFLKGGYGHQYNPLQSSLKLEPIFPTNLHQHNSLGQCKQMENHQINNEDEEVSFISSRALIEKKKQQQFVGFAAECSLLMHELGAESTAVVVASLATSGVAIGAVLIGCLGYIMQAHNK